VTSPRKGKKKKCPGKKRIPAFSRGGREKRVLITLYEKGKRKTRMEGERNIPFIPCGQEGGGARGKEGKRTERREITREKGRHFRSAKRREEKY